MVIDLAVITDHIPVIRRTHRLCTIFRQIQYRQSAMSQNHLILLIQVIISGIRSAMKNGLIHPQNIVNWLFSIVYDSVYSTHSVGPLPITGFTFPTETHCMCIKSAL